MKDLGMNLMKISKLYAVRVIDKLMLRGGKEQVEDPKVTLLFNKVSLCVPTSLPTPVYSTS